MIIWILGIRKSHRQPSLANMVFEMLSKKIHWSFSSAYEKCFKEWIKYWHMHCIE